MVNGGGHQSSREDREASCIAHPLGPWAQEAQIRPVCLLMQRSTVRDVKNDVVFPQGPDELSH